MAAERPQEPVCGYEPAARPIPRGESTEAHSAADARSPRSCRLRVWQLERWLHCFAPDREIQVYEGEAEVITVLGPEPASIIVKRHD